MAIRIVRLESGQRIPLLAIGGGVPDAYVADYVVGRLIRLQDFRTTLTTLHRIADGLSFCNRAGIDIVERCRSGTLLTELELDRLARWSEGDGPVPLSTAQQKFSSFAEYVAWLGGKLDGRTAGDAERIRAHAAFARAIKDASPAPGAVRSEPVLGLTPEQRATFLAVIIPGHARNPFRASSFRNFVFFSTSFVLGLRTGELLGLKIEDVDLARGLLHVRVRPNDPDDPRRIPADQKTLPRTLPLSTELATALRVLREERRGFPAAKRHKYVFVNACGDPLGDRGARLQYEVLREAVPELGGLFNHRLRHDWNDRWLETAEAEGWNLDEALRQQVHAMGWVIGSTMPSRYGQRAQRRRANARLVEVQRQALGAPGAPARS